MISDADARSAAMGVTKWALVDAGTTVAYKATHNATDDNARAEALGATTGGASAAAFVNTHSATRNAMDAAILESHS